MGVLFLEFPDLHFHLDPVLDSVYIASSCRSRFYFFILRGFTVLLTHPLFNPSVLYIAIPLYMAHPFPPPATTAVAPATPLASPPQQVPSISLDDDNGLSEATSSSSSSSAPGDGFAPHGRWNGKWIPFFGIHLGELSSTTDGDV